MSSGRFLFYTVAAALAVVLSLLILLTPPTRLSPQERAAIEMNERRQTLHELNRQMAAEARDFSLGLNPNHVAVILAGAGALAVTVALVLFRRRTP
jgi:hypothetical protein